MKFHRIHKSNHTESQQTQQKTSQFAPRPFAIQAKQAADVPPTPEQIKNQAFDRHKFEATGLEIKEKYGTITPQEQEHLGVLRAKMDEFWAQRTESTKGQPNLLEILINNAEGTPVTESATPIQPKLTIGQPGDKYEQEADRVAAQVVQRLNVPQPQQSNQEQILQRQETPEEEDKLQKKTILQRQPGEGEMTATPDLEGSIQRLRGSGQPLANSIKKPMEQAFGEDFSGVKVHTDAQSNQLNQSIQAKAFTTGQDIFFRQGEYNPDSKGGQELLAHELTHTIQQKGTQSNGTIQRLPTRLNVTGEVGEPKQKKRMSERYKTFLNALDTYGNAVTVIIGDDAAAINNQQEQIFFELDKVIAAAQAYNKDHQTDERSRLVAAIGKQAGLEKAVIKTRAQYFINNPTVGRPMWSQVIPKEMGTRNIELNSKTFQGTDAGAINTVSKHQLSDTYTGFFKEDKSKIEAGYVEMMGIPMVNPNFANRSIAMYRIDQLLGANVISRTDYAFQKKGIFAGTAMGTISQKAKGENLGKFLESKRLIKTDADKVGVANPDTVSLDDPVLQRCLSKINIVDAIAFQVDRHAGNFYVETDGQGNVISLTGIDNDLAFPSEKNDGRHKKVTEPYRLYPGISYYADKQVAEMVLALDENDLKSILSGLLTNDEIELTVERLQKLKTELQTAKNDNQLLEPNQWNAATAATEQKHASGYIADNRNKSITINV